MWRVRGWLIGALCLGACAAPVAPSGPSAAAPPCTLAEQRQLRSRVQETQAWIEMARLADATPRPALGVAITRLQVLRRQAQEQAAAWPPCAQTGYALWLRTMDADIAARLAYSAEQPYAAQQAEAERLYVETTAEFQRLLP